MLKGLFQSNSFQGVVGQELTNQVDRFLGKLHAVAKPVLSRHYVLKSFSDVQTAKRKSSSQPTSANQYMKAKITPMAKLSILKSKGSSFSTSGAMKLGVPTMLSESKPRYRILRRWGVV